MKTFKISHGLVFLTFTLLAVFEPLRKFPHLYKENRIKFNAFVEYILFLFFSLALFSIYIYFFTEKRYPRIINLLSEKKVFKYVLLFLYCLSFLGFLFFILSPDLVYFTFSNKVWLGLCFSIISALILDLMNIKFLPILFPIFSLTIFSLILFLINQSVLITNYPLSLGWSEASHFGYGYSFYSLVSGKNDTLMPYMNFSRYLLLSLPWFFKSPEIIYHRLWETILRVGTPLLTSFLLFKRVKIPKPVKTFLLIWGLLFLLQGPIYYHLLIIPIFIFWKYSSKHKSRFVIIFLISIWAGFSRINWVLMPVAISILIYLLETLREYRQKKSIKKILKEVFFLGTTGMFGGIVGYILTFELNNQPSEIFFSAYNSSLLWNRLFPSEAFGIGVLIWVILIFLPAVLISLPTKSPLFKIKNDETYLLIYGIIGSILIIFFFGGLLVSSKIGGGGDIHNMDAFLLLVLVFLVFELNRKWKFDFAEIITKPINSFLLTLVLIIPSISMLSTINEFNLFNIDEGNKIVDQIQQLVSSANDSEESVLLLSEQHLILFGKINGVDYQPSYEKTLLMEAVMSNNQEYLDKYIFPSIKEQGFDIIITEIQPVRIRNPQTVRFGDEYNYLYTYFSKELLKHYYLSTNIDNYLEIYYPINP